MLAHSGASPLQLAAGRKMESSTTAEANKEEQRRASTSGGPGAIMSAPCGDCEQQRWHIGFTVAISSVRKEPIGYSIFFQLCLELYL